MDAIDADELAVDFINSNIQEEEEKRESEVSNKEDADFEESLNSIKMRHPSVMISKERLQLISSY